MFPFDGSYETLFTTTSLTALVNWEYVRLAPSGESVRIVVNRKIATTTPSITSGSQRGHGREVGVGVPGGLGGPGGRSGGRLLTGESNSSFVTGSTPSGHHRRAGHPTWRSRVPNDHGDDGVPAPTARGSPRGPPRPPLPAPPARASRRVPA